MALASDCEMPLRRYEEAMPRIVLLSCILALVSGCNRDPAPGAMTTQETRALDDAAQMIDSRRLPDDALRPPSAQQLTPGTLASSAPPQAAAAPVQATGAAQ